MKKLFLPTIIALTFIFSALSLNVFAAGETASVYLDNELLYFDVSPEISSGRTMVPMRAIFEKLNADVTWDSRTNTARAYDYDKMKGVSITIGSSHMTNEVTGSKIPLDVPAIEKSGRTLVPLRAISEAFGCDVQWDGNTNTVNIFSEDYVNYKKAAKTQKIVNVSTASELLNSIGSNKKIILTSSYYNLSNLKNVSNSHVEKQLSWDDTYLDSYIIKNVENMTIEGNAGTVAEIEINDIMSDVLRFENCKQITLSGLKIGHATSYEQYQCEGAVAKFVNCSNIHVNNCNLYGCGAVGVFAENVNKLYVSNSKIYDCSYTGIWLASKSNAVVNKTEFFDSSHSSGFLRIDNSTISCTNCNIHDIICMNEGVFIDTFDFGEEPSSIGFTNCSFTNNDFNVITNDDGEKKIVFNDCIFRGHLGKTVHPTVVYNNSNSSATKDTKPTVVSYDNISANINQIKEMINKGLYLEAIQECKNARNWHTISPDDEATVNNLEKQAENKYNEYVKKQQQANLSKKVSDSQKRQMFSIIKQRVSAQLKSPSNAIWPDYTASTYYYNKEGKINVMGQLEAMNGFGGYGRLYYIFTFNEDLSIDYKYIYD